MSNSELYIGKTTKHAGQDFVWNGAKWVLFDPRKGPGVITIIGPEGPAGPAGAPGAKGDPGEKGDAGSPGAAGQPGADGAKGDKGDAGERGLQGIQGVQGIPGNDGAKGDAGERGLQGLPGAKGDKGEPGEQGIQGVQGLPGLPGADGVKGDKGDPGEQGIQGVQGLPGAEGVDGQDGSDGAPGTPGAPGKGVPTGGAAGQILAKTDAGDFLTAWVDAPTGGATAPAWHGVIHGAYAGGSTPDLYREMTMTMGSGLTASALTRERIRLLRFYNPATITVHSLRALCTMELAANTSYFIFAIYNDSLQKISANIHTNTITASAWTWAQLGSDLNVTLQGGQYYYIAVTCATMNSNTPFRSLTPGSTHLIYNLPIPSVLAPHVPLTFRTAATTAGVLPSTLALETTVLTTLSGGFPALFLSST